MKVQSENFCEDFVETVGGWINSHWFNKGCGKEVTLDLDVYFI